MADSRINLLSSASSTASDDFFVVDGNTNGTRKLNAFSPTIGGNLAVTGTLTAGSGTFNGTVLISSNVGTIGKSGSGTGGNWRFISDDGTTRWLAGLLGGAGETSFDIYDLVNGRSLLTATAAGVLKVPQTTASTTTSSGALVIGNGTQGGLGVGGAVNIGGTLTVNGTNPSSIPRLSLNSPVLETYNFSAIGTVQSADVALEVTSTAATGVGLGLVVRRTNGGEFARFINGAVTTRLANMSCDAAGTYFSISSAVGMFLDSTKTMLTGGNVLIGGTTDIPGTGGLKVFGTTASTTTSTGALVVGNGTSGGLGVGGSINTGGTLRFHTNANLPGVGSIGISATYGLNMYASTGSSYDFTVFNAAGSSLILNPTGTQNLTLPGTLTVNGTGPHAFSGALTINPSSGDIQQNFQRSGTGKGIISVPGTAGNIVADSAVDDFVVRTTSGKAFRVTTDGGSTSSLSVATATVSVLATTASTTTSTGALVVSGGVGIGGETYIGGVLECISGSGIRIRTASTVAPKLSLIQTSWVTWEIQNKASSNNFFLTSNGSTDALTLTTGGNATLGGSITTSAPSGGTAAAWKLGTVATVSPTSPNRTIEVDIGGTIYYLAAKTTNN